METVYVGELLHFVCNLNMLGAISKGMREIKHCSNKIPQFLGCMPECSAWDVAYYYRWCT